MIGEFMNGRAESAGAVETANCILKQLSTGELPMGPTFVNPGTVYANGGRPLAVRTRLIRSINRLYRRLVPKMAGYLTA
jgi:hypothetical protein